MIQLLHDGRFQRLRWARSSKRGKNRRRSSRQARTVLSGSLRFGYSLGSEDGSEESCENAYEDAHENTSESAFLFG